ncbi:MAG: DUF4325 domain-containing protein [Bacteroides sp.]|nr:DUF4325 domain-containing protein [Bacteroides sp.]
MGFIELKIVTDFSRTPGVRYKSEGPFSGEEFRKEVLLPKCKDAITNNCKLKIYLDGTAGLGTSFLEESFGGLIREDNLDYQLLKDLMCFISEENPDYIDEINEYMKDAYEKKHEKK